MITKILAHTQSTACPPQAECRPGFLAGKPATPSDVAPAFFVSFDDYAHTASADAFRSWAERSEPLRLLEKFTHHFAIPHILTGKHWPRVPTAADTHSDLFSTYSRAVEPLALPTHSIGNWRIGIRLNQPGRRILMVTGGLSAIYETSLKKAAPSASAAALLQQILKADRVQLGVDAVGDVAENALKNAAPGRATVAFACSLLADAAR